MSMFYYNPFSYTSEGFDDIKDINISFTELALETERNFNTVMLSILEQQCAVLEGTSYEVVTEGVILAIANLIGKFIKKIGELIGKFINWITGGSKYDKQAEDMQKEFEAIDKSFKEMLDKAKNMDDEIREELNKAWSKLDKCTIVGYKYSTRTGDDVYTGIYRLANSVFKNDNLADIKDNFDKYASMYRQKICSSINFAGYTSSGYDGSEDGFSEELKTCFRGSKEKVQIISSSDILTKIACAENKKALEKSAKKFYNTNKKECERLKNDIQFKMKNASSEDSSKYQTQLRIVQTQLTTISQVLNVQLAMIAEQQKQASDKLNKIKNDSVASISSIYDIMSDESKPKEERDKEIRDMIDSGVPIRL